MLQIKNHHSHVLYPVENPPKVNRTEPYRAVPCNGKAPIENCNIDYAFSFRLLYADLFILEVNFFPFGD